MISWCRILRRSHARIERIRIILARNIILNGIFTEAVHAHVRHTRTERSCINLFHLFVAHLTKKSKKHNRITCVVVYKNKKVETRNASTLPPISQVLSVFIMVRNRSSRFAMSFSLPHVHSASLQDPVKSTVWDVHDRVFA